jgi:hypothetical protein
VICSAAATNPSGIVSGATSAARARGGAPSTPSTRRKAASAPRYSATPAPSAIAANVLASSNGWPVAFLSAAATATIASSIA